MEFLLHSDASGFHKNMDFHNVRKDWKLYSSDLRDVAVNDTSGLMATMTIAIEIPSVNQLEESASDISDVMRGPVSRLHPKRIQGCRNYEFAYDDRFSGSIAA